MNLSSGANTHKSKSLIPQRSRGHRSPAKSLNVIRAVTSDAPDGRPWPPTESNVLWVIVARADGCTI
jgi:hypothetical protein